MTVAELIEKLRNAPQESKIIVWDSDYQDYLEAEEITVFKDGTVEVGISQID